jgi:S1-C subfamily serine protease
MTDHGDWWGPADSSRSAPSDPWPRTEPGTSDPGTSDPGWSDPGWSDPAGSAPRSLGATGPLPLAALRPRRRLLPGVLAGAVALAVSLAAGAAVVDHQSRPFSAAGVPGLIPPAADTSATSGGRKPATTPKPSTGPEPVLSVQGVQSVVEPGVVVINSQLGFQNAEAAGTGMVLSADGEVLTNNHVIDGATSISVTVVSTGKHYVADVVGTAADKDVAVLQLEGASGLATVPIGDSDRVTAGQQVVALGNAGGAGTLSVVTGQVTATDRSITASDQSGQGSEQLTGMIEIEAPIQAGDSGGPLASRAGKVIGMDTAASASGRRSRGGPTSGFAIPINRALTIAAQIRNGDSSGGAAIGGRGYLGIQVQTSDPLTGSGGAQVVATTPGSPAAVAGLESGDVITSLNGQPVSSADDLTTRLGQTKPGQRVTVGWTDQSGDARSAQLRLTSGPAD